MNLLTSANSGYMDFTKIFFKSLKKISDYHQINTIFVIDNGLSKNEKAEIRSMSDKVHFRDASLVDGRSNMKSTEVHSKEWKSVIQTKTKMFSYLLNRSHAPLIFIDLDCYFRSNFLHLVDTSANLILCKRKKPEMNEAGYSLTHIGSFFGVGKVNAEVKKFINTWSADMKKIPRGPMETPALCELLRRYNGNLDMCNVSEELVSWFSKQPDAEKFNKCSIVHLKSSGPSKKVSSVDARVERLVHYVDVTKLLKD